MSEGSGGRTPAELEEYAAEKGRRVVYPTDHELFIDIDSRAAMAQFAKQWLVFEQTHQASFRVAPSPSGRDGRYHVTVTLGQPVRDARERILLQALLGSDIEHELLSLRDLEAGSTIPTVFFELPIQEVGP